MSRLIMSKTQMLIETRSMRQYLLEADRMAKSGDWDRVNMILRDLEMACSAIACDAELNHNQQQGTN